MSVNPEDSGQQQFGPDSSRQASERDLARRRLERKRKLIGDIVAYVVINAFLIGLWFFVTGAGYFWPGWVLAGWGVLLVLDAWDTFYRRPITEADIEKEIRRVG